MTTLSCHLYLLLMQHSRQRPSSSSTSETTSERRKSGKGRKFLEESCDEIDSCDNPDKEEEEESSDYAYIDRSTHSIMGYLNARYLVRVLLT